MKIQPITKAMIGLTAAGAAGAAYVLVRKRRHDAARRGTETRVVFRNAGRANYHVNDESLDPENTRTR